MSKKSYKPMKVPLEFEEWVEKRRQNIQKAIALPIRLTKADAMRLIASSDGVELTKESIKKMRFNKR